MKPDPLKRLLKAARDAGDDLCSDLALRRGLVTPSQLADARAAAEAAGRPVVDELRDRGLLTPSQLGELRRLRRGADAAGSAADVPEEVARAAADPTRLVDRYVLVEPVGSGGGGSVWRAWDGQLHRWVALKQPRDAASPSFRQRFLREARAAATLRHPHLVAIHDTGEFQGRPYLVMEFVKGRPIGRGDGLRDGPERIRKAAVALDEAHRLGIVHRDLKPGNLLVDDKGEPRVVDFGLAWVEGSGSDLTGTGAIVGTPSYMAPEQARGKLGQADPRTDVYGLGAVLYDVLTGRPPHAGETALDILDHVRHRDPVPPRKLNPAVPADLESICLKALEKDPYRRYETAADFAADLERHLDGRPVLAQPSTFRTLAWRRLRRHPAAWTLSAATLAALALLGALAWNSSRGEDRAREALSLEEHAGRLSTAYHELRLRATEPLRVLEDRYHDGTTDEAARAALAEVESACADVAKRWPQLRLPAAWRGLAVFYAGRSGEGRALLDRACAEAGEDPFPAVLRAASFLAEYARSADLPVSFDPTNGTYLPIDFVEVGPMAELKASASRSLGEALSRRVWPKLRQGREFETFTQGALALGRGDYPAATGLLDSVRRDPALEGLSCILLGFARFSTGDPAGARDVWSRPVARGWPLARYYTAGALLNEARAPDRPPAEVRATLLKAVDEFRAAGSARVPFLGILVGRLCAWTAVALLDIGESRDARPALEECLRACRELRVAAGGRPHVILLVAESRHQVAKLLHVAGESRWPLWQEADADFLEGLAAGEPKGARLRFAEFLSDWSVCLDDRRLESLPTFERALEQVNRVVESPSAGAEAWTLRGAVLMHLGLKRFARGGDPSAEFRQATEAFDRATQLAPENPYPLASRAEFNLRLAAWNQARNESPEEPLRRALSGFTAAISRRPAPSYFIQRAQARYYLANWERARGVDPDPQFREGIADAGRGIPGEPLSPRGYWVRALLHFQAGLNLGRQGGSIDADVEAAYADFNRALELRPDHWESLRDRGSLSMSLKRYEEGVADVKRSLEINPDQPELRKKLEDHLKRMGR